MSEMTLGMVLLTCGRGNALKSRRWRDGDWIESAANQINWSQAA